MIAAIITVISVTAIKAARRIVLLRFFASTLLRLSTALLSSRLGVGLFLALRAKLDDSVSMAIGFVFSV